MRNPVFVGALAVLLCFTFGRKAGYKVEKEETFLERDGLYVLRLK